MAFTARRIRVAARAVAGVSLIVGLTNTMYALGASGSISNPVDGYGKLAFGVLVIVAVLRLFAAVGLWAFATWGAFLLAFASIGEMALVVIGSARMIVSPLEFGISILLLASAIGLMVWRFINIQMQGKRL